MSGFGLIPAELHVLPREPRRTRKSRIARRESDRTKDLAGWACGRIIALRIRANSRFVCEAALRHSDDFGQLTCVILRDSSGD
ncbi:MAG: hypothetical protein DME99_10320 [Verrucomicrobia bacterium]|nr:MAG: hypothetical protein DME99_10320 [Verrucomicrobiota bacterium]